MPLCGKKSSKPSCQKVVIPRGMVNPGETTVIEIPAKLNKQPVVVAKRKQPSMPEEDYEQGPSERRSSSHKPPPTVPLRPRIDPYGPMRYQSLLMRENPPPQVYSNQNAYRPIASAGAAPSNSFIPDEANLNQTELEEQQQLQESLKEFQKARRKLLQNASLLASRNLNLSAGGQNPNATYTVENTAAFVPKMSSTGNNDEYHTASLGYNYDLSDDYYDDAE